MAGAAQETVADQALTIACCAVGANWSRDFAICIDRGLWGSKSSTASRMRHQAFARIRPGQLGIAVHGFRWQDESAPPRNAQGAAYGPRAPFEHFLRAQFSELALFEVEAPPYSSTAMIWSETEPDEWDLRIPINVYAHERDVELRMDEIDPAVAEAIRKSGIYASMPWVFAPATLGRSQPTVAGAPSLSAIGASDVLALRVCRREASWMRDVLLAGRSIAPCAFCARECVAEDLEVAHLKERRICSEQERLDPRVAVLACVICHHGFDAGAIFVDADGVIRTTAAAQVSRWREELLAHLDGQAFSCFGAANEGYLASHRQQVAARHEIRTFAAPTQAARQPVPSGSAM